jgi:hypothetical protein
MTAPERPSPSLTTGSVGRRTAAALWIALGATVGAWGLECSPAQSAIVRPAQFSLKVERVGQSPIHLSDALVTVTNLTGHAYRLVTVSCRFYDKAGGLIDAGQGFLYDVGPKAEASQMAQGVALYKKPSSAQCRISDAVELVASTPPAGR